MIGVDSGERRGVSREGNVWMSQLEIVRAFLPVIIRMNAGHKLSPGSLTAWSEIFVRWMSQARDDLESIENVVFMHAISSCV